MKSAIIYSDGACSGNPGPGGWGSIVVLGAKVQELGGASPSTTNNRMEMTGVLEALSYCIAHQKEIIPKSIQVYTDSVYVIRGITEWIFGWKKRGWKTADNGEVSNREIWIELDQTVQALKKLDFELKWSFVKGHAGVPGNERCDVIAVCFSKDNYVDLYEGSVENYHFDVNQLPEERPLPEMKGKGNADTKVYWYISLVNGVLTKHKTWAECEATVKGRPAKYKKVSSEEEATAVKKSWGV
jgi:ribonuclease HI